jgi:chorismate synthase
MEVIMGIRYLSSGESHGPELTAIIEGFPSNVEMNLEKINYQLARRQKGHGRGGRMLIEKDQAQVVAGIRFAKTTGAPICIKVTNDDWVNWEKKMAHFDINNDQISPVSKPRPGHADLSGGIKYQQRDLRNILERASARETTIRVATGAVCRQLLEIFGIEIYSHVLQIGEISVEKPIRPFDIDTPDKWADVVEESPVRCYDSDTAMKMMNEIDTIKKQGDSVGGIVEIIVTGMPIGIGSYAHWERKLDSRLAAIVMSVQAMKGVEFGIGFQAGYKPGSLVHDEIYYTKGDGFYRNTNNAGGIEGGISNGEPIIIRAAMKPIPTLYKPLQSVDIETKQAFAASIERSDACAVPAAAVVIENAIAIELANAMVEKFSGDSIEEMTRNWNSYNDLVQNY